MGAVSCRSLGVMLKAGRKRGADLAVLIEGVPHDISYLRNTRNHIEWHEFCRILSNARAIWSLEELSALGESFMRSPFFSYVGVVARLLFNTRDLFDWICKRSVGGGAQLFSGCVKPSYEHVGGDITIIRLEIQPGYQPSSEFFWMTRGAFIAMPRMVGSGFAAVDMVIDDRLGTYRIKYKVKRGTLSSLVRWVTSPFAVRAAAKELKEAHESLQERYQQLESTRAALERKQLVLDAAHRLGHRIWGQRETGLLGEELTRNLLGVPGIIGARLVVDGVDDQHAGDLGPVDDRVVVLLSGRQMQGRLEASSASGEEARALLDLLAPSVALAVDNAVAYRELEAYQRGLEQQVEQRTAELRQARDALAGTVDQLREAQQARERFFHNISHEIRTPLSLILLAVADIEGRARLDPESKRGLEAVVESARRLLRLVDELLLLAAAEQTQLRIEPRPTDLAKLAGAIVNTWKVAAEQAGLTLQATVPRSLVITLDPIAIERVITNLLSNAVKFTPRGGRIALELVAADAHVDLTVRDTGLGIDDDLLKRLFGRFERGHGTGRSGSGIGLALVKELVDAHQGTIEVKRHAGGGTEFRICLPGIPGIGAASDDGAPTLRPTDFGHAAAPVVSGQVFSPPGGSSVTIVVAEDNPRLSFQIAKLLSEHHTVITALDGLAAADLIRQHQPQLLVTDVNMPGMNGIELTRQFRALTNDALAPVVILSAVSDLSSRVAGLEAGAVDYINKPFDPIELVARVRSQLAMRDLAIRLHRSEQLSAMGTLSSGLAHELRNPANGIVNAVAPLKMLLPAELRDPEGPVGQLLDVLSGCAEQIGFLSRQLLAFKRGGELELRVVPLGRIMQRALMLANDSLRDVNARDRTDGERLVRCAPPLLVQVLTNLVENAAHAAGAGGWVEIRSVDRDGRLVLEVSDSGPGVPVELRERIFEAFFTTKAPGVGTGLGLPLSREIVHRHGGVLEVRERDGRSTFVVDLPAPAEAARPGAISALS